MIRRNARPAKPRGGRRLPKANTQTVLGRPSPEFEIPTEWREHYEKLVSIRNRVSREKRNLKRDARQTRTNFQREMADMATNSYDGDLALGLASSDQELLFEIDEAIQRIRDGTYGKCQLTGKPIPKERLQAIPWTRFAADAEQQLEGQGTTPERRPRLGRRARVPKEEQPESFGEDMEPKPKSKKSKKP